MIADFTLPPGRYRERPFDPFDGWDRSDSGLYLPATISKKAKYGPWPLAMDLFCGAGGFSLGIHQAGFRTVAAVDNDEWACATFLTNLGTYPVNIVGIEPGDIERLNRTWERACVKRSKNPDKPVGDRHGELEITESGLVASFKRSGSGYIAGQAEGEPAGCPHFFFGDVRKLTGRRILGVLDLNVGDLDLVVGGPPCQGFSTAGKRNVMDPQNSLVFEFARLICELRPTSMVMENVPAIASMRTPEGPLVLDVFCRILEDGEFGTYQALRESLLASAGLGAALKGRDRSRVKDLKGERDRVKKSEKKAKKKAPREAVAAPTQQLSLGV